VCDAAVYTDPACDPYLADTSGTVRISDWPVSVEVKQTTMSTSEANVSRPVAQLPYRRALASSPHSPSTTEQIPLSAACRAGSSFSEDAVILFVNVSISVWSAASATEIWFCSSECSIVTCAKESGLG
jgi:hypothetical protein